MAKKITSVAWNASDLPTGISFDNSSGTFSGTPTEVGDYTVPVQVTTNYGNDAKDLTIHVVEPAPVTYIVSFESNGGSAVASQTVNSGGKATQPSNPTKTDYNFAGWYSDSALTSQFDFNTAITKNTVLYAKWAVITYTVTFESNGGPEVEPQTVIAGETATRPSSYSRTGYTFDGWFTESELTNEFDFTTPITGNITLYAGWIIKYFLVTFNSQGGTKIASQKVNYNDTVERPDNPTKEGFGFLGWFLDKEGTSEFDFATPITEKTVLYAAWEAGIWTVTFISNGGSSVATQKVNSGEKATEPSKPTRTGYTFKGWYSDSNLATKFSFTTKITSDITLYAKWLVITYSVAFESNGGTAVSAQTVAYGDKATQPNNPTKSDYTFGGWYTDSALTSQFDFNTAITGNMMLYAKWNTITYTVTFNSNGGSSVTSQTVNLGEKATQPTNPTKSGYNFAGWYSDSGLTSQFSFSTAITKNTVLYAKWNTITYTVTFNSNGGSVVASQSVNHGGKVTQPSNPTKSGYTFKGWYSDSALTNQFNFATAITSNITLYANWEVSSQTYNFVVKATNSVGSMEKAFSITVVS